MSDMSFTITVQGISPMKALLLLFFVVVPVAACSNGSASYCEKLRKTAELKEVQAELMGWVDRHVKGKSFDSEDVLLGGGMWPGVYWYPVDFDWSVLGFGKRTQIRLVGPKTTADLENVQSVYFGERSRYGILVSLDAYDGYGLGEAEANLTKVSHRIAVVCGTR